MFSTVGSGARGLHLPIWLHADHTGVRTHLTLDGLAGFACWCIQGEDFLLTGRRMELC